MLQGYCFIGKLCNFQENSRQLLGHTVAVVLSQQQCDALREEYISVTVLSLERQRMEKNGKVSTMERKRKLVVGRRTNIHEDNRV